MHVSPFTLNFPLSESVPLALLVIAAVLALVFQVYVFYRILDKMGYSGWWALLAVASSTSFLGAIYLAFTKWPIERDVEWYRRSVPDSVQKDAARRMLELAMRLRADSKFSDAKSVYEDVMRLCPGTAEAREADKGLTELRLDELWTP